QKTSENLRKPQKTSENLRKPQKTSENLRKPQKTSENLRKPYEKLLKKISSSKIFTRYFFRLYSVFHLKC
ncbi:hypothetical protein, partial [Bartonella sp. CL34QHWL]